MHFGLKKLKKKHIKNVSKKQKICLKIRLKFIKALIWTCENYSTAFFLRKSLDGRKKPTIYVINCTKHFYDDNNLIDVWQKLY